jgi:hypothetical protein
LRGIHCDGGAGGEQRAGDGAEGDQEDFFHRLEAALYPRCYNQRKRVLEHSIS